MIYVPIDIKYPINTKKQICVQFELTNNFPEIVFELHDGKLYYDLNDDCSLSATITNTDLETVVFTGTLSIINPHRGQILCILSSKDFSMTGINTLTVKCDIGNNTIISFQTTIFVQSVSSGIVENI